MVEKQSHSLIRVWVLLVDVRLWETIHFGWRGWKAGVEGMVLRWDDARCTEVHEVNLLGLGDGSFWLYSVVLLWWGQRGFSCFPQQPWWFGSFPGQERSWKNLFILALLKSQHINLESVDLLSIDVSFGVAEYRGSQCLEVYNVCVFDWDNHIWPWSSCRRTMFQPLEVYMGVLFSLTLLRHAWIRPSSGVSWISVDWWRLQVVISLGIRGSMACLLRPWPCLSMTSIIVRGLMGSEGQCDGFWLLLCCGKNAAGRWHKV